MLTAIVKTPASSLVDACELTFLDRVPMDRYRFRGQHGPATALGEDMIQVGG